MPNIMFHGFGNFPFFINAIIKTSKKEYPEFAWSCILPTTHHLELINDVLEKDRIMNLQEALKTNASFGNLSDLQNYPDNIFRTIETDKNLLKEKTSQQQLDYSIKIYQEYKKFILQIKPSYILFFNVESVEGVILFNLAKELGIRPVCAAHTRHIGRSFFSETLDEQLPPYATVTDQDIEHAKEFIRQFRETDFLAANYDNLLEGGETFTYSYPSLIVRMLNNASRVHANHMVYYWRGVKISLLNNVFPWYRDFYRGIRARHNSKYKTITRYDELPLKYIFYPLQYTPEASINIPEPEYINQRKAIDAIRFAMPNDTLLVVKEHPACITVRPGSFVKSLLKCAGVVVADYRMSSKELIRRSVLTTTVNGSASIEAFLMGCPVVTLGDNIYSEFWGGKCRIDDLHSRIFSQLNQSIPEQNILGAVAKIYNVSFPFTVRAEAYSRISVKLVKAILDGLCQHVKRLEAMNKI